MINFLFSEWLNLLEADWNDDIRRNFSTFFTMYIKKFLERLLQHNNSKPGYLTDEQKKEAEALLHMPINELIARFGLRASLFSPFIQVNYDKISNERFEKILTQKQILNTYRFEMFPTFDDYLPNSYTGRKGLINQSVTDIVNNEIINKFTNLSKNTRPELTGGAIGDGAPGSGGGGLDTGIQVTSNDPTQQAANEFADKLIACVRVMYKTKMSLIGEEIKEKESQMQSLDDNIVDKLLKIKFAINSFLFSKFISGKIKGTDANGLPTQSDHISDESLRKIMRMSTRGPTEIFQEFKKFAAENVQNFEHSDLLYDVTALLLIALETFKTNSPKTVRQTIYNSLSEKFKSKYPEDEIKKRITDRILAKEFRKGNNTLSNLSNKHKTKDSKMPQISEGKIDKIIKDLMADMEYPLGMREKVDNLTYPFKEILTNDPAGLRRMFGGGGVTDMQDFIDNLCQKIRMHLSQQGFFDPFDDDDDAQPTGVLV
jgi:hypothetical protein